MKHLLIKSTFYLWLAYVLSGCNQTNESQSNYEPSNNEKLSEKPEKLIDPIPSVKIGNQIWMKEDLKTKTYTNGDSISIAKSSKDWKEFNKSQKGCYLILPNGTFIYNGFALTDKRGILPNGFYIPTYEDFNGLFKFLGSGDSQKGIATKAISSYNILIEEWIDDPVDGGLQNIEVKCTNSSGFSAQKGGFVYDSGNKNEGNCSFWWTSSLEGNNIVVVDIGYCSQDLGGGKGYYPKEYGFAIRGLKK
jgi:uncharacterized protein (TIGR02145 family)